VTARLAFRPVEAAISSPCGHGAPSHHLYDGVDRLCGVPGRFSVVRCRECGLGTTVPRLGGEALEVYYPDTYPSYQPEAPRTTLRQRVGTYIDSTRFSAGMRLGAFRKLSRSRPGRLLDVGCGRGDLAAWFAARGWQVAGVEPDVAAASLAAERGIEVHRGTLDDAPWPPQSFDAVTFNHSLEHVPDPSETLRQAGVLLRPGAVVAVSVPNFGAWQRRLFGSRWFHLDLPRHLQHFDRASLVEMATGAGLEPEDVRTTSSMLGFLGSLQYTMRGRLFLSDVTMHRAMHLTYPLVLVGDLVFREGDCLHVVARRPPGPHVASES
jgi:2-polyprenyl-3-methyl-5-hydroxy-6-metoxy-1,4-benzoquinol methylase